MYYFTAIINWKHNFFFLAAWNWKYYFYCRQNLDWYLLQFVPNVSTRHPRTLSLTSSWTGKLLVMLALSCFTQGIFIFFYFFFFITACYQQINGMCAAEKHLALSAIWLLSVTISTKTLPACTSYHAGNSLLTSTMVQLLTSTTVQLFNHWPQCPTDTKHSETHKGRLLTFIERLTIFKITFLWLPPPPPPPPQHIPK